MLLTCKTESKPTVRQKIRIMQIGPPILALVMTATLSWAGEIIPDITNSDAKTFKAHLGKIVSIQGRLSDRSQGAGLSGAIPKGVFFTSSPSCLHRAATLGPLSGPITEKSWSG